MIQLLGMMENSTFYWDKANTRFKSDKNISPGKRNYRKITPSLPSGINIFVPYDASEFIEDSINEVFKTIIEAILIVLVVFGAWVQRKPLLYLL